MSASTLDTAVESMLWPAELTRPPSFAWGEALLCACFGGSSKACFSSLLADMRCSGGEAFGLTLSDLVVLFEAVPSASDISLRGESRPRKSDRLELFETSSRSSRAGWLWNIFGVQGPIVLSEMLRFRWHRPPKSSPMSDGLALRGWSAAADKYTWLGRGAFFKRSSRWTVHSSS